MKRTFLITITLVILLLFSSCGLREQVLAPPDEIEVPSDAMTVTCTKDDVEYRYVYEGHVLYLYYIDNEKQTIELRDDIQELIILSSESMELFLNDYFPENTCIINDYK